jgi:hypothetical protein
MVGGPSLSFVWAGRRLREASGDDARIDVMPLKDTLTRLQEEERQKAKWEKDKPKHIKDWQVSVTNLFKEIRSYLKEYEADGSISFSDREIELTEESLGRYRIPSMSIIAGPATIMLEPVGTMLVGAWGRVDMYRQGRGGEQDRILLLRLPTSRTDSTLQWKIRSQPEAVGPAGRVRGRTLLQPQRPTFVPLSKEILEQKLEDLLR